MKKAYMFWIIVLFSCLLAVSGCGQKKEETGQPAKEVLENVTEEPELPTEGVKSAGPDVTAEQVTPVPAEIPVSAPSETPAEVTTQPAAEESTEAETLTPAGNDSTARTADNYRIISFKDLKAYPTEMKIKVGTTVEWRNVNDNLLHIIGWSGQKQMGVKPEPMKMGESWSYTFNKTGKIVWFSTAHPSTQGTIYVEE